MSESSGEAYGAGAGSAVGVSGVCAAGSCWLSENDGALTSTEVRAL